MICLCLSRRRLTRPSQSGDGLAVSPCTTGGGSSGGRGDGAPDADGFSERVVQVRRVTKVVKGGKQMSFRAVVVVGNGQGTVGVGCAAAKEVPPWP